MSTKRISKNRLQRARFTPAALGAFRKMRELFDTDTYQDRARPSDYSEAWWDLHRIIWRELNCQSWEWPCVQHPGVTSPYPPGSEADKDWRPKPEAQARYLALETAVEAEDKVRAEDVKA